MSWAFTANRSSHSWPLESHGGVSDDDAASARGLREAVFGSTRLDFRLTLTPSSHIRLSVSSPSPTLLRHLSPASLKLRRCDSLHRSGTFNDGYSDRPQTEAPIRSTPLSAGMKVTLREPRVCGRRPVPAARAGAVRRRLSRARNQAHTRRSCFTAAPVLPKGTPCRPSHSPAWSPPIRLSSTR